MKKHCKHLLFLAAVYFTAMTACNKYLGVTPKGYTLLTSVTDYDQLLNDGQNLDYASYELNNLGDNVDMPDITVATIASVDEVYVWAAQFSPVINSSPAFWGEQYARINEFNTVLLGIDKATGGTGQQKASLTGEALLGRALEYFYLVNEYGNSYDPATAGKDIAVPFVTSNDVAQVVPPRSTVQQIYDHIIADINTALPNLPPDNSNNRFRGSVGAAYSVLARVYLYMGDYTDAANNAQLALQHSSATMIDYNNTTLVNTANPGLLSQPDVIYGRTVPYGDEAFTPTIALINMFNPGDLRLKLFYKTTNAAIRGGTLFKPYSLAPPLLISVNFGTSVQEMKLIIAEAASRSGDLTTALQQLNSIRADRFQPSAYQQLQSSDRVTVLNWVMRERDLEFPFSGLRWFDMRRLNQAGAMDTVRRYDADNNVIATLPPHSPRYTFQIPIQEMHYHPDWIQNP
jgi:hypothetical protein